MVHGTSFALAEHGLAFAAWWAGRDEEASRWLDTLGATADELVYLAQVR